MTTLLDKKRSAIGSIQDRDEATLDQVLSSITALAPVVVLHARCGRAKLQAARNSPARLSL
jgi:hypothetical protein